MYRRGLKTLDPVDGLVQYVLDIKPYHTKIIDVLVEYVYTDPLNVIILDELFTHIHLYRPSPQEEVEPCHDGYGVPPYGGPGIYPIFSPYPYAPSEVPAIDVLQNAFLVPHDATDAFVPNSTFTVEAFAESNWKIVGSTSGVAGEVIIQGNATHVLSVDLEFFVEGPAGRDIFVTRSAATYNSLTNETTIPVKNFVISADIDGGTAYIRRIDHLLSKTYNVYRSVYDEGQIPIALDPLNPIITDGGVHPHTIVYVNEDIVSGPPTLLHNEEFVIFAKVDPLAFVSVVPYANIFPRPGEKPNEYQSNSLSIVDIDLDENSITVRGGDLTRTLRYGMMITVFGSMGNDGDYTVETFTYELETNETTIWVTETIPNDFVDGMITLHVGSNAFVLNGDYTDRYTQGSYFTVPRGTFEGRYDVAYSTYHKGKTYVRPTQDVLDFDAGYTIFALSGSSAFVRGNKSSVFKEGRKVVVKNRSDDNGVYELVADAVFEPTTNTTEIFLDRPTITFEGGGEIQIISFSEIHHQKVGGFGSYAKWVCKDISEAAVRVDFNEKFAVRGIGTSFYDDVIAYNLENERKTEIDFPKHTIYDTTAPLIYVFDPGIPVLNTLWFDQSNNEFKWYNGHRWIRIIDAYWFNTTTNELWRTTRSKFVPNGFNDVPSNIDGWVLDKRGGYSYLTPAVPALVDKERYSFVAENVGFNTGQTTYTIPTPYYDLYYTYVRVDNIPAQVNWTSTTTFEVLSPTVDVGSIIEVILKDKKPYAKDGYPSGSTIAFFDHEEQQNVVINPYGMRPHHVYHGYSNTEKNAVDYPGQDAYILRGGNYVYRFTSLRTIDVLTESGRLETQVESFGIVNFNQGANSFEIPGDYSWLFTEGRVFFVDFSPNVDGWYTVNSSSFNGTNTVIVPVEPIRIIPAPTDGEYANTDQLGVIVGAVYDPVDSNDPVKTIIVPTTFQPDVVSVEYMWIGPLHFDIRARYNQDQSTITFTHGKTEIEVDFVRDPRYEVKANVGSLPEPNNTSAAFGEKLFIMTDMGNVLYLFEQSAGPIPPDVPTPGTLWYDTVNQVLMVWADYDFDGTYEWTEASTTPSGAVGFNMFKEFIRTSFSEMLALQVDWGESFVVNTTDALTSIGVGMSETFAVIYDGEYAIDIKLDRSNTIDLTSREQLGVGVGMRETLTVTSSEITGIGLGEFDTIVATTQESRTIGVGVGITEALTITPSELAIPTVDIARSGNADVSTTDQLSGLDDETGEVSSASFTEALVVETVSNYPITGTDVGSNFITVTGDITVAGTPLQVIDVGDTVELIGSGGGVNDGTFTVLITAYNSINNTTEITLNTTLSAPVGGINGTLIVEKTLTV